MHNLIMTALGIRNDQPPTVYQPKLLDGVHLRWAFRQELGFPLYGFYLFRRPHLKGRPVCLSGFFGKMSVDGPYGRRVMTPLGALESDRPLVMTDYFAPEYPQGLDLFRREWLRFDMPDGEPARRVEVKVGFYSNAAPPDPETTTCISLSELPIGRGDNPRVLEGASFQVSDIEGSTQRDPRGELSSTRVINKSGLTGLDCGSRLIVQLPRSADVVELILTHFSKGPVVRALGSRGTELDQVRMTAPPGEPEAIRLNAPGIRAVAVEGPTNEVLLRRLCFGSTQRLPKGPKSVEVTAYMDRIPVESKVVKPTKTGEPVTAIFEFEHITSVRLTRGAGALLDLCYVPVSQGASDGWGLVPGFTYPLCLPLAHANYPCPGKPATETEAEQMAVGRVRYGDGSQWAEDESFEEVHELLELLVDDDDPDLAGVPMADRFRNVSAEPSGDNPDQKPPQMPKQRPLDLLLLASVHPAVSQMMGLSWVDKEVDFDTAYDYLIIGDWKGWIALASQTPDGQQLAGHALHWWQKVTSVSESFRDGFLDESGADGYIVYNQRAEPRPPLQPLERCEAYALPGNGIRTRGESSGRNAAGLRWRRESLADGILAPGASVLFHLWRADVGDGEDPPEEAPDPDIYKLVTEDHPVLPSVVDHEAGNGPDAPLNWPPFRVLAADHGLRDGWYSYRVSGIDIFGRHSPHSQPAVWRQWAPKPDPEPWYYQAPEENRVLNSFAIHLIDDAPPPPPTGVEAYALDPQDSTLVRDERYEAWHAEWQPNPDSGDEPVIGLRVRWRWTRRHMEQAPDTREFRVYLHPGDAMLASPEEWRLAKNWQDRIFVVDYDEHVEVEEDDNGNEIARHYDVLLPMDGHGDAGRLNDLLAPSRDDPVVYAFIAVSAADHREHRPDVVTGGPWGGRDGHEGPLSARMRIHRVLRTPPPPPAPIPPDGEAVYATPADYHSRSYYTYRWKPETGLKVHIFRALDEAVFLADWRTRVAAVEGGGTPPFLVADDLDVFPSTEDEPRWNDVKRLQVAEELNKLNEFLDYPEPERTRKAMAYYHGLSNDGLRTLAGLPGTEKAYTQLTVSPKGGEAYTDTLDGRARNRYFYRAAYVDGAHNKSPLGLADPPVHLPKVKPPRRPVITKVTIGDAAVTLSWAANREPDLREYRVYRTKEKQDTRDLRLMELVHLERVAGGNGRASLRWTDEEVVGGRLYHYRVVAADDADNASRPSAVATVKVVDRRPPEPPVWEKADWVLLNAAGEEESWPEDEIPEGRHPAIRLRWRTSVTGARFIVTRKARRATAWQPLARESGYEEVAPGEYLLYDPDASGDENYSYRLTIISPAGVPGDVVPQVHAARAPQMEGN